jgi:multiple sugar transport system permease protein
MRRPGSSFESWVLIAPFLAGVALLVVGPGMYTVVLSLYDADLVTAPVRTGLRNFAELWDDPIFRASLRNSLIFIGFSVPVRTIAAITAALILHRSFRGAGGYRSATFLPTVVPDAAFALAWLWILNPLYGPINLALGAIGLDGPAWLTDRWAAMAGLVLISAFTIGEGFLIAMASRRQIPDELYELAALEGARPWAALRRVTLPLMAPTLVLLVLRDSIYSFQHSFVPSVLVTEGGPAPYGTTMLPLFIYRNGFQYLRFGYAAAATVVMLGLTALLILAQYAVLRRWRHARVA